LAIFSIAHQKLPQILILGFLSSDFTFRAFFGSEVSMTQQWDPVWRMTWQGDMALTSRKGAVSGFMEHHSCAQTVWEEGAPPQLRG